MNGEELEHAKDPIPTERWPAASSVAKLLREVARARAKFPNNRYLLAALVEEVGELGEAMISGTRDEIENEAIQCACVAIRIAEEGDATVYVPGLFIALVTATGNIARGLLQKSAVSTHLAAASGALQNMFVIGLKKEAVDPTFADITDEEAKP